jgi:hypothetical protein
VPDEYSAALVCLGDMPLVNGRRRPATMLGSRRASSIAIGIDRIKMILTIDGVSSGIEAYSGV